MDNAQFKARIDQIYEQLESYSYYDLLNLSPSASVDEIQQAFHRMALTLHPDRYHGSEDADLRRKVSAIYKRIAEGYRVLTQHQTRSEYHEALAQGKQRLVKIERQQRGPKRAELAITNLQARKFFLLGRAAEQQGDKKNAKLNYKFALDLEPDSSLIQERMAALDQT